MIRWKCERCTKKAAGMKKVIGSGELNAKKMKYFLKKVPAKTVKAGIAAGPSG